MPVHQQIRLTTHPYTHTPQTPNQPTQDEMTSQVCHAAARPEVRADPERAQALLGCFLHMAELARVDGALAFPVDFPVFVQGVMGAWRGGRLV